MAQVLGFLPKLRDANVLVGTETHDDAGVYRLTEEIALVQTIDFFPPVVDDPYLYGQIAASNALSDVYAMGAEPRTALNLVCYPDDELGDVDWLGRILQGGAERCHAAGVALLGGHSVRDREIKFGMAVTGIVHPEAVLRNVGAHPGDRLILTKPLGTGFVTTAAVKGVCPPEVLTAACASMVELNKAAKDAVLAAGGAHAVTDVTGFGLAGHALEMAEGSGVTLRIDMDSLPTLPGVIEHRLTRHRSRASRSNAEYVAGRSRFDDDPDPVRAEFLWDAQTSGGLLVSVAPDRASTLLSELRGRGVATAVEIGEVLPGGGTALVFRSRR